MAVCSDFSSVLNPPGDGKTPGLHVAAGGARVLPPECRTFHGWLQEMEARTGEKITIRDFDGLDRADFQRAYYEKPMTETEFQHRLGRCTMSVKLPAGI